MYCASNQHIRMFSEGSCDTEDWTNDNQLCHHRNKLHLYVITTLLFFYIFDQINADLISMKDLSTLNFRFIIYHFIQRYWIKHFSKNYNIEMYNIVYNFYICMNGKMLLYKNYTL